MATYSWYAQGEKVPPTDVTLELVSNDGILASPFTGAIQTVVRPKVWRMALSWRNISGDARAALIGFFLRLNGVEHRVRLPLFGQINRGTFGGVPVVDGGAQAGHTISIRGATPSQTGWAKAGDILRWGNTMHMVTVDADSDVSGDVEVSIIPEIRDAPTDGTTIVTTTALTSWWILEGSVQFSYSALRTTPSGQLIGDLDLTFIDDVVNA